MSRFHIYLLTVMAIAFTSASARADDYPDATGTPDPNVVISPFPPNKKIDITGFLPGDLARDPHTNQIFRVPARKATPLVFKPEVIGDDPAPQTGTAAPKPPDTTLDGLPVRRPEIVEEPGPPPTETIPNPQMNSAGNPLDTQVAPPPVAEPKLPDLAVRAPRNLDGTLGEFIKEFIRSGQADNPNAQAGYFAAHLSSYYGLTEIDKDRVIAQREMQIARWPRRIYVISGKPRFVQWVSSEDSEDEFVIDIRVYQSLKDAAGTVQRGYADHRLTIHEKPDGTFEITGIEERHPRSVLAEQ